MKTLVCSWKHPGIMGAGVLLLAASLASAQEVQHLSVTVPGGMPGTPIITSVDKSTNGVTVTWDGPSGYYMLLQTLGFSNPQWQTVAGPTLARKATISTIYSNAFFRVNGPAPKYAGDRACLECHENIHTSEMDTRHAQAFSNPAFAAKGGQTNTACLVCHTVGYGLPTGFQNLAKTPHLAGVQCESCHGPAANHAANEYDFAARPRIELAATVCGGCHTGSHQPTYEEWHGTGHAEVVEDMNPSGRITSCGRCHSGSSRVALLKGDPAPIGDANVGITCVVCHNPHQKTGHPAQLRHPVASTNDYFLTTSSDFGSSYNPNINVCAQCHNHRGATWSSSSRPPHYSPQYNMLIGTVGELVAGTGPGQPAVHGRSIEKQCVGCHMQTKAFTDEAHPAITGHKFKVETYESCRACHSLPEELAQFTSGAISNQIQQTKVWLDFWAATKAPAALWAKYEKRAWEYTNPGRLSTGGTGPTTAEQAQIPDGIKKARFNLYIVLHDGSFGVHNGPHTVKLLDSARKWIQEELSK